MFLSKNATIQLVKVQSICGYGSHLNECLLYVHLETCITMPQEILRLRHVLATKMLRNNGPE